MAETFGTAKLIAKDEMLCVQFEPPINRVEDFHNPKSGHPIADVITKGEKVRWLIYYRGVFGWRGAEREDAFVDYCEARAGEIGYEVINGLLRTSVPVPVVDET